MGSETLWSRNHKVKILWEDRKIVAISEKPNFTWWSYEIFSDFSILAKFLIYFIDYFVKSQDFAKMFWPHFADTVTVKQFRNMSI